jgi:Ca2+-binding RTX toxin-like protein
VSDTLDGIEAVIGTAAADEISGAAEDGYFFGGLGNDIVSGGAGDDTIAAGSGADTLSGGAGFDLVDFGGAAGPVILDLANAIEITTGTAITTVEAAIGTNFADLMTGDDDANYLAGGEGADTLDGAAGNDSFIGGGGADEILFEAGDGYDAIFGFESGVDVIDASAYSIDPDYAPAIFEYQGSLVIAFGGGDNLYLVGESLATFDAATDLRL